MVIRMKIIVIGSIAAGVSAASKIAAGSYGAQVTVYERGSFYSCGVDGLPHYLGVSFEELNKAIQSKETELAKNGIKACLQHEVKAIDPAGKTVTVLDLGTGRSFQERYDKLVIATGSTDTIPRVKGAERLGVHTLKNVEELVFLKEFTKTPYVSDIVVLGASWSGLEIAKVFLKMGRKVRIIDKSRQLLPEFDPDISQMIQKQLELEGVTFSLGETVRAFPGKSYVEQVQTERGSYPCDLCISTDNPVPNTELLRAIGAELTPDGAVLVDEDLATSVPDVYAVGNCAVSRGGSLHTASIRVGDTEIARTGLSEAAAKRAGLRVKSVTATGSDRPGICPNPQHITIKLIYDATTFRVLGAQAWGGKNVATRINAIAVAISAGMSAKALAGVDFCFSSAQSTIWDPIQIVCGMVK